MPLHIYFNNKNYFIEKSKLQGKFDDLVLLVESNLGDQEIYLDGQLYSISDELLTQVDNKLLAYIEKNPGQDYDVEIDRVAYTVNNLQNSYSMIEQILNRYLGNVDNSAIAGRAIVGLAIVGQGGL